MMELAGHLDSPNLPHDEAFLRGRLQRAERSFAELGPPAAEREYQLALEDSQGRVIGTSAVIAKHGTPEMPHTFLRVRLEERRAESARARGDAAGRTRHLREAHCLYTEMGATASAERTAKELGL